jgi:hypothetical protein
MLASTANPPSAPTQGCHTLFHFHKTAKGGGAYSMEASCGHSHSGRQADLNCATPPSPTCVAGAAGGDGRRSTRQQHAGTSPAVVRASA